MNLMRIFLILELGYIRVKVVSVRLVVGLRGMELGGIGLRELKLI